MVPMFTNKQVTLMPAQTPEYLQCEKPIIKRLESEGWKYKRGIEVLENENEPLLISRLKNAIVRINGVSEKEAGEAINLLKASPFGVEGSRRVLDYLKNGVPVKDEDSIKKLKEVLTHADGKRGTFITLIHKFRTEDLNDVLEGLKRESRRRKTITNRRDVVVLIDEGHRTQYGELASTMRSILKSASFFAFTGTPIAKKGRDTYATFGYRPYLDRYFITQSIEDGFTVKIAYQARLEEDSIKFVRDPRIADYSLIIAIGTPRKALDESCYSMKWYEDNKRNL